MIATIAVDTSEIVDKHWADSSAAVDMIVANKPAAVILDIVDNFAAVDMAAADIPVAVDTVLADTVVVVDKNSAEYQAVDLAVASFEAVDRDVLDSLVAVVAATAMVVLAAYWQAFGK